MEKEVFFKNRKGQTLAGVLSLPKNQDSKTIVMLHGFTGDKDEHGLFVNAANTFCSEGYAVLRFDFAGSGESEGLFRDTSINGWAEDFQSAIKYLKKEGLIENRVGVLALSLGASAAIVGYNQSIAALVLLSPAVYYNILYRERVTKKAKRQLEKNGYFKVGSLEIGQKIVDDWKNRRIESDLEKVTCPTLIVHGEKDKTIPCAHAKRLYNALKTPSKKLEVISGADHVFTGKNYSQKVIQRTKDWFDARL